MTTALSPLSTRLISTMLSPAAINSTSCPLPPADCQAAGADHGPALLARPQHRNDGGARREYQTVMPSVRSVMASLTSLRPVPRSASLAGVSEESLRVRPEGADLG